MVIQGGIISTGHVVRTVAAGACGLALAAGISPALAPERAYAADLEQLSNAYTSALQGYEDLLAEQDSNAQDIARVDQAVKSNQRKIEKTQGELDETMTALYKERRSRNLLTDLLFTSTSFQDAVIRYESYERVERYCVDQVDRLSAQRAQLSVQQAKLQIRKQVISGRISNARKAAEDAQTALLNASHADGAEYHQVQGVGNNCGATAFIVAVNMALHENRYTDNVEVWEGPGFNRDSTTNLAARGLAWLIANNLSAEVGIEDVPGDVKTTGKLKDLLDQGNIVILSSGPGSIWQRADGTETEPDVFPDGHFAVFYRYEGDVFFSNDSSVSADKGAGIAYTEEQMQQWLDGRENHFACIVYKKSREVA